VKAPTLIVPARPHRPPPQVASQEVLFVPPEALFPDLTATEATKMALFGTLSRDAVLLACARLNADCLSLPLQLGIDYEVAKKIKHGCCIRAASGSLSVSAILSVLIRFATIRIATAGMGVFLIPAACTVIAGVAQSLNESNSPSPAIATANGRSMWRGAPSRTSGRRR
jgi:hypothetical protein